MRDRKVVLIVVSSALIVAIGMGVRPSLGLFLAPITAYLFTSSTTPTKAA